MTRDPKTASDKRRKLTKRGSARRGALRSLCPVYPEEHPTESCPGGNKPRTANLRAQQLPPETIDGGTVICFAEIGSNVQPTGRTTHLVGNERLPPFQRLVVIQYEPGGNYHLLYCDQNWRTLTDTCHHTLDEAKAQAEFEYKGVGKVWKTRLKPA